ncbi:energy transducer TonB [Parendozoicomonas haliclonae]|nr:energy transducer TonB [Parendozoicomonas haliclonae]
MKNLRILPSLALAVLVTGALLYLMHTLIDTGTPILDDRPSRKLADIYMPERKIENRTKEQRAEKPDSPEEPPPDFEPPAQTDFTPTQEAGNLAPPLAFDLDISLGTAISAADGEYLPVVKVNPVYPRRANSRGIEGYCIVEYTVTSNGSTRNPTAVDCAPKGVFESASIKAAARFKYKPRVVDGTPIEVPGVRNRFTFRLEN